MKDEPLEIWSAFLASPAALKLAMTPLELDGYLTGIVVTPQADPILPSEWMARLWRDSDPIFADEAEINTVFRAVTIRYNILLRNIDRSLARLRADRIVDYRPLFLAGDQKPTHDMVRTWARGFWKAIELAPMTWNALIEDERTRVLFTPFLGFFDVSRLDPGELPDDIDSQLDEHAALIPRMILVMRRLAAIRENRSRPAPARRHGKVGRNDPCPCGSGKKYKRCCHDT